MEGRFFLPFRYDSGTKQFVPEFYTNVAENVFYSNSDLPDVENVKQALDLQNVEIKALTVPTLTTVGSANSYTLTPDPAVTQLTAGMRFRVKFHAATTSTTVNINVSGLGNKRLYRYGTTTPAVGTIPKNSIFDIEYDGTNFILVGAPYATPFATEAEAVAGTVTNKAISPATAKAAVKSFVDTELKQFPLMFAPEPQYIYTTGDAQLTVLPYCTFALQNGTVYRTEQEITLSTSNLDTGSSFQYGKDYYVYAVDTGTLTPDVKLIISLNSSAPNGATTVNSRKIGGFHYGKCRRVNDALQPVNNSGVVRGSSWASAVFNGIVPRSVWTLLHRPKSAPEGMVYLGGGTWVDIYLSSDNGAGGLASIYNSTPLTGTEGLDWYGFTERALAVGKRLPSYEEFCQMALGSPQGNDGNNNNAWSATANTGRNLAGGVVNAVSSIGVRDAVGNVWKWLGEFIHDPTGTTGAWHNVFSGYGKAWMYSATGLRALFAGGSWNNGASGGARAVICIDNPWFANETVGAFCASDSL